MNISISKSFFKDRLRITVGSTLTDNPEVNQTSGLLSSLSAEYKLSKDGNVPCYTFLYNHAPKRLRDKIDKREQQVAQAEQQTEQSGNTPSMADKARHAVRHTIITKQVVNLFIKNMSENDEHKE